MPGARRNILIALAGLVAVAAVAGVGTWWAVAARRPRAHEPTPVVRVAAKTRTAPRPSTPAARALDSVGRIDAALRTGVDFRDYSALLDTATAAVSAFRPADAPGARLKAALAKALLYDGAAREAWDLDLGSAWWGGQDKPAYWTGAYPDLRLPSGGVSVTADQVRQAAWVVAGRAYADAARLGRTLRAP